MIKIRKAEERGHFNHGWLDTYHTFSFSSYQDPDYMSFRSLRVMNEDRIAPGEGFGTHPHRDMEIVTYVLQGAIEHRDSMGNGEVLRPGEFQRMSAGRGITHSEFNPSQTDSLHLYQIWLYPAEKSTEPSYEQKQFTEDEMKNQLRLVASPTAEKGSLRIGQDASIWLSKIDEGNNVMHSLTDERHAWLQVLCGSVAFNDTKLNTSDGAAISDLRELNITAIKNSEIMLFDLN